MRKHGIFGPAKITALAGRIAMAPILTNPRKRLPPEDMKARYKIALVVFVLVLIAFRPAFAREDAAPGKSWSTAEINGVRWILDPDGKPFYSKGVNLVTPWKETEKTRSGQAYCWLNFYPSLDEWRKKVGGQLKGWGFNTLGGWSDSSPDLGLALTVDLELGRNSRFHWFDPFDPKMEEVTIERAKELTAPYRDLPFLIGYYSDNEVGWWNSALFSWFLKAGWENWTKRHLWQMLHDHYGGSWEKLLEDWVPQGGLDGFEALKGAGASFKLRPGGGGIRLVDRFMHDCAKRYYELMFKAVRAAHPGALVLGDRLPLYYHQDAVLAMGDNVDVISTNYNVDAPDGWVAPYYFDGLRKLSRKPVLITEFFFAAEENRSGNRNETARSAHAKPGHLMTVDTQTQRVWGAGNALLNFARFPNVAGAHWFQYCDEPLGGREDGEDYNMGLIDTANRPYEDLTRGFVKLNATLDTVHETSGRRAAGGPGLKAEANGSAAPPGAAGRVRVPRAPRPIDVSDGSLIEWEKESTLLPGFAAPAPYVPFGDAHLAWAPEGFYLFSLSNTYVDPDFLEYGEKFPHSEAFQLHFSIEAEGRRDHFAAFLLPGKDPRYPDGFGITPELFRIENGRRAERLPEAGRVRRIEKSLPHMVVEAFFPARWFGLEKLEPGMRLGLNIGLVSYFREFTMTLAGNPEIAEIENPARFREIVLE
ncbi:MAG: hypothetical protein WAW37_04070 [Syntrophobacteraceae bacterium]